MSGWLLDTNVLSELRKPAPARPVLAWIAAQPSESLHVSVVSLAEVRVGIGGARDVALRRDLERWLELELVPWLGERVLPVSEAVCVRWLGLLSEARARRRTLSHPDSLLAATAAEHDLVVASRNLADFRLAGVAALNPWTGERLTSTT